MSSAILPVLLSVVLVSIADLEKPCSTREIVDASGMTYIFGVFHILVLAAVVGVYIAIAVVSWKARRSTPNNNQALDESKMTKTLVRSIGIFIGTNVVLLLVHELTRNGTGYGWIQLLGYWIWEVRMVGYTTWAYNLGIQLRYAAWVYSLGIQLSYTTW